MSAAAPEAAEPEPTREPAGPGGDDAPQPAPPRTAAGDIVTDIVLRVFRLNGQLLAAAERMARPVGLTAAWWQVLGAVLREPGTVAGIARDMGLARQSVQRIADLLVERGLAEYLPNPAHRRAKLLRPSTDGWAAIRALVPAQHTLVNRITEGLPVEDLRTALAVLDHLIAGTAGDTVRHAGP